MAVTASDWCVNESRIFKTGKPGVWVVPAQLPPMMRKRSVKYDLGIRATDVPFLTNDVAEPFVAALHAVNTNAPSRTAARSLSDRLRFIPSDVIISKESDI